MYNNESKNIDTSAQVQFDSPYIGVATYLCKREITFFKNMS